MAILRISRIYWLWILHSPGDVRFQCVCAVLCCVNALKVPSDIEVLHSSESRNPTTILHSPHWNDEMMMKNYTQKNDFNDRRNKKSSNKWVRQIFHRWLSQRERANCKIVRVKFIIWNKIGWLALLFATPLIHDRESIRMSSFCRI